MTVTVGDKIRVIRKKRGWTATKLANLAGVSKTTIHYTEKNVYSPTEKTIRKIAKALDIHPGVFWMTKEEIIEILLTHFGSD